MLKYSMYVQNLNVPVKDSTELIRFCVYYSCKNPEQEQIWNGFKNYHVPHQTTIQYQDADHKYGKSNKHDGFVSSHFLLRASSEPLNTSLSALWPGLVLNEVEGGCVVHTLFIQEKYRTKVKRVWNHYRLSQISVCSSLCVRQQTQWNRRW